MVAGAEEVTGEEAVAEAAVAVQMGWAADSEEILGHDASPLAVEVAAMADSTEVALGLGWREAGSLEVEAKVAEV